jgi:hypothetical protein
MQDDPMMLAAIALGVVVLLAIVVALLRHRSQQRSLALRAHFGPEYDRALAEQGGRARAERVLAERQKRFDKLHIRRLSAEESERFGGAWVEVQQRFVDDPAAAVHQADALVKDVMSERGYPMSNFEQRVADLSVEHAQVIDHYRAARAIAQASVRGEAGTEDLRQAMVHYRALFNDLLESERASHGMLRPSHA